MMTDKYNLIIDDDRWQNAKIDINKLCNNVIDIFSKVINEDYNIKLFEINIMLSDDNHLKSLSNTFRNKDKPTNILSFPSGDLEGLDDGQNPVFLGDLALSYDTLHQECIDQNKQFDHHFQHLLIHGMLHLIGYDHETDQDAETMETLEIKLLSQLNVPNPYETN